MDHLFLEETLSCGSDHGQGNLLGIQPFLTPPDYASANALERKLGGYLDAARGLGWVGPRTVAVLPEYTAAWLVAAGEGPAVTRAVTTYTALRSLLLRRPLAFLRAILVGREKDRLTASVFRVKARETAQGIQRVFGGLARRFGVTLAAGSAVLPEPVVVDGVLRVGRGPLVNTALVFGPDGGLHPRLASKIYPISSELPFIAPARAADLPVFETPAGRLGVLVCADSWYPDPYCILREQGVQLLAVPSFISGFGVWETAWRGYDGAAPPAGVDGGDVGRLSEAQAWRKYALAGRMDASGAAAGINVFLHGRLWDLGGDGGRTLAVGPGGSRETAARGAALVNCWL